MRIIPFIQTSVFVDTKYPFGGNQLATFWDSKVNTGITKDEMQAITREMNFSESTFLETTTLKECSFKVRIFTPASEIPFAGHPTLGTAFVLKQKHLVKDDTQRTTLELGVGPIEVEYNATNQITMKQPQPTFGQVESEVDLITRAIGLTPDDVDREYPIQTVSTGFPFLIVPLKSLKSVKKAAPNVQVITQELQTISSQEILIFSTECEHSDSHAHVRMFAPTAGVLEDPATGSAAGPLGAYLEKYQILKEHTIGEEIRLEQGFEIQRPSQLVVRVPNEKMKEVYVSGRVRLTAEGNFILD